MTFMSHLDRPFLSAHFVAAERRPRWAFAETVYVTVRPKLGLTVEPAPESRPTYRTIVIDVSSGFADQTAVMLWVPVEKTAGPSPFTRPRVDRPAPLLRSGGH